MPQVTFPAGLTTDRGEQLSLSTTLASLGFPPGMTVAMVYVPSTNFRLHLNPAIKGIAFYDASAAAGARFSVDTQLLQKLTDRDTGTGTGSIMNSSTTSDRLYICTSDVIGGFRVTIGNANGDASTLAAAYSKNDGTFATQTIGSDGTDSGGATLGQTGSITWTAPTDAMPGLLGDFGVTDADRPTMNGYWWRLSWGTALDASVSITEIWTLNKDTNREFLHLGQEYDRLVDRAKVGAIELVLAAGTDTADVNWGRMS